MRTVWIYVDTNKQVGDVDNLKVFANPDLADEWFNKTFSRGPLLGGMCRAEIASKQAVYLPQIGHLSIW